MNYVIFDMDGVIFDSEHAVLEGWREISEKYGVPDVEIPFRKCIGVNSAMARSIFLEYYGDDFPYDVYSKEQSINFHRKYDGGRLPMKSGVKELLSYLKETGFKIALASSTRTQVVSDQLNAAGLLAYFDVVIGGDQVQRSKPEPDIFLKAAYELGVPLKDGNQHTSDYAIYVIEDSFNGIRAAHAAGMIPIMVPDMIAPDDEMYKKAAYIFNDLSEVKDFFQSKISSLTP